MADNTGSGEPSSGRDDDGAQRTGEAAPLIVGIGASAGGLQSLREFFQAMPIDSGLAFVVVQHLQHGRKSMMADVLASYTDMPVSEASDACRVVGNHVYVIPSDSLLTIAGGRLKLEPWPAPRPRRMPIDAFLCSLAADQARNAVAIVMSGAGSDGTIGVRAIKEHGGLAMAEALSSARGRTAFESMPQSAVATGLVDFVVPAAQMPRYLIDYARHLREVAQTKGLQTVEQETADHLKEICAVLLTRKGQDFRHYKSSTLVRRIRRRMQILRIESAADYVTILRQNTEEAERLSSELLVCVTSFFRDPEAFEALKDQALRPLVKDKTSDDAVRIWVAGCSTGEEAYTMAILMQEVRNELDSFPSVQIFATDIDRVAIDTARSGRYPKSVAEDITPERLRRYFLEDEEHYRVNTEIRELCIFSEHDLIQSPPFSRLDLISCRNLLIYLDSELQKRLIPLFHYALRSDGYLFLGSSENVTYHRHLFATVDKHHRIFRRREIMSQPPIEWPAPPTGQRVDRRPALAPREAARHAIPSRIERTVLDRYGPVYVVVDDAFNVVQFSRGTGRYLEQPPGAPRTNLIDMARPGLRAALRTLLNKVVQAGAETAQRDLAVTTSAGTERLDVVVSPIGERDEAALYLVVFLRASGGPMIADTPAVLETTDEAADPANRVAALERELAATREDLQTTIEELETSNEELQSANEELLSMNEELQSSNEELETSKEEIQSVNEELETVNQELNHKINELDQVNTDLTNLLNSTDIATIFLDNKSQIKWFAPAARRIFNLIESDIGRPITDITAKFDHNDLDGDIATVLRRNDALEREVVLLDAQKTFVMRVLPYRDSGGRVDGVVITFQDITPLREAERASEARARETESTLSELRSLLEVVPVGIAIARDPEARQVEVNPHGAALLGLDAGRVVSDGEHHSRYQLIRQNDSKLPLPEYPLLRVLETGERLADFEGRIRRPDGSEIEVAMTAAPIRDPDGKVRGGVSVFADITPTKAAERQQRLLVQALQHRVRNILSTVRAMARETRASSKSLDDFFQRFEGRLDALATAETIVARTAQGRVDLEELVAEALPPAIHQGVHVAGPTVALMPRAAQMMALVLNELTTNALKFGALSVPEGRVRITWSTANGDGGRRLRFDWQESGLRTPPTGGERGFGLDLIETGLPYELGGTAEVTFGEQGLACTIEIPLDDNVEAQASIPSTEAPS